MKLQELTVLLPCHSLEDFPVYHEGTAAEELLAAWCAAWQPALVAEAAALPEWQRIDIPPEELAGRLVVVPPFCLDRLPAGFTTRIANEGGRLVAESDPAAAAAAARSAVEPPVRVDDQLAADFYALGFCRLQMELLTRQMRYVVNIDETHFRNQAVSAAQSIVAGEEAAAREHLQQCFDTLYEARKHFYPVDVYLLDITLLAESTLGESLSEELAKQSPLNLLASGQLVQQLATEHSENWASLLRRLDHDKACLLGGDDREAELPLLPLEVALDHLRAGAMQYEQQIGRPPVVYGRRRAGLWPALPQLLAKLGYQGALHFTLDDGKFPLGPQCKTRWEGLETSVIDIYARVPSDAARPETFLSLSRSLSDSMDSDHVATVAFAHWPAATSRWYDVLRRIAELSPVLGRFLLLDEYFMHTDMPGRLSKFTADEYRTPYLKQAIIRREADPTTRFLEAHRKQGVRSASATVQTLCELLGAEVPANLEPQHAVERLADLLPRQAGSRSPRALVFNAHLAARRIGVELPGWRSPPDVGGAVLAAGSSGNRTFALVDVPSLGFAWLEPGTSVAEPRKSTGSLVDGHTLRNEYLEVRVSGKTGGIQALYNFRQRGNQLSQQLARRGGGSNSPQYSSMRAESIEVTADSAAYGEICTRGVLLDEAEKNIGRFRQRVGLWAGSRLVNLEIELSDLEEPRADPWNSYYAARFAWPDEQADLYRGVSLARQCTTTSRLEAPEFIDIDNGAGTVTILTGGLPYHRRSGGRMLDTVLVARGDTARQFSLALGVDLPNPATEAAALLMPPLVDTRPAAPPQNPTGWFFHLGSKNVIATHWEPIRGDAADGSGEIRGFRVRLLETAGSAGRVPLRAFRSLSYARQIDFMGETILELYVDDDKILLDFGPYELLEVEALWIR